MPVMIMILLTGTISHIIPSVIYCDEKFGIPNDISR
jgi:hypothetical protein